MHQFLTNNRDELIALCRLSTLQRMDRLVVLDGGNVAEQGTHAELLRRGGHYAALWRHQSGGFLPEVLATTP